MDADCLSVQVRDHFACTVCKVLTGFIHARSCIPALEEDALARLHCALVVPLVASIVGSVVDFTDKVTKNLVNGNQPVQFDGAGITQEKRVVVNWAVQGPPEATWCQGGVFDAVLIAHKHNLLDKLDSSLQELVSLIWKMLPNSLLEAELRRVCTIGQ